METKDLRELHEKCLECLDQIDSYQKCLDENNGRVIFEEKKKDIRDRFLLYKKNYYLNENKEYKKKILVLKSKHFIFCETILKLK